MTTRFSTSYLAIIHILILTGITAGHNIFVFSDLSKTLMWFSTLARELLMGTGGECEFGFEPFINYMGLSAASMTSEMEAELKRRMIKSCGR